MIKENITLVIGASENESRYSNIATRMLLNNHFAVVAFGKRKGKIQQIEIETDWENIKQLKIHTVTLYINPSHQEKYISLILKLKPERIIFNPGTENPLFTNSLENEGIKFEFACTIVMINTNQYAL
ncbi:MAG: CoA-binding protein [Bacteroidota bacterium]|nr:CoA-binding protein [Bacteroidota bacterium]